MVERVEKNTMNKFSRLLVRVRQEALNDVEDKHKRCLTLIIHKK